MGMLKEFREFAVKGNVIDLAVGVIIGGAFGTIVDSVVKDLIMPLVGLVFGKLDFSNLFIVLSQLPEQQKQMGAQLLTTAATLERGFQAFLGSGNLQVFQSQIKELEKLHQQWISDLASYKNSLRAARAEPMTIECVEEAFGRLAERIKKLAG